MLHTIIRRKEDTASFHRCFKWFHSIKNWKKTLPNIKTSKFQYLPEVAEMFQFNQIVQKCCFMVRKSATLYPRINGTITLAQNWQCSPMCVEPNNYWSLCPTLVQNFLVTYKRKHFKRYNHRIRNMDCELYGT